MSELLHQTCDINRPDLGHMVLQHWTQVQVINIPKGMAELAGLGRQQVNTVAVEESHQKPKTSKRFQNHPINIQTGVLTYYPMMIIQNVSKPNYKIMIQTTPWLSKPNAYPGPCEFMVTHANSLVPISSVLKSLCPYWPHAGWIVGTWAASSHGTWWHLQAKHRSKSCTSLHGHMKGSHESHCYFHFKIGSSLGR